jgi:pimeloyl-ACP methyl ester carboxylesterase
LHGRETWGEPNGLYRWLGAETIAALRELSLLRHDLAPVVPRAKAGDDVVILIHGFLASAGVFRPMRARLERDAHALVATFTHPPGRSVRRIARQLERLVGRIPRGVRIHLVGHSLGGVVARWFVQELGGHSRVEQTISLASPFGGTGVARALPLLVGAELRASSRVLARLRATAGVGDVPHTSIIAGDDRLVFPNAAARFPRGDAVVLEGRGHNALLFDREATGLVIDRIRRHRM